MSDVTTTNGRVTKLSEGEHFEVRGHEFTLSVREAFFAFEDIRSELVASGETGSKVFLQRVQKWVAETCGVDLTLGEADELSDRVTVAYNECKKKRNDAVDTLWQPRLPSSTA